MEHDLNDFWHKIKMYNFDIAVLLMTAFVLRSQTFHNFSGSPLGENLN